MKTRAELIKDTVEDLVVELLWDGRKEDDELPRGAIENSIATGEISSLDIVKWFSNELFVMLLQHDDNVVEVSNGNSPTQGEN